MSAQPLAQQAQPAGTYQAIFPGATQSIVTSGTSQQLTAWALATTIVRVICSADCFIAVGANPTASSASIFLPSGTVEYFGVIGGQKLAVIQSTASGTLYVLEGL